MASCVGGKKGGVCMGKGSRGGSLLTRIEKSLAKRLTVMPSDLKGRQFHLEAVRHKGKRTKWYIFEVTRQDVYCINDFTDRRSNWITAIEDILWAYDIKKGVTTCGVIHGKTDQYIRAKEAEIDRKLVSVQKDLETEAMFAEAVTLLNSCR